MARRKDLDQLFAEFPYEFGDVTARKVRASNGRQVLQLRVDMGVLQMEVSGRPDGTRPGGHDTYYDYLVALQFEEGEDFELDERRCLEIDREFVQFFHRRISWLALREFELAILDANHTLALMDFSSTFAPDPSWAMLHEQYRPFVLFHRTQAQALVELMNDNPRRALKVIEEGLQVLREVYAEHDLEDDIDEDELMQKLVEMKQSIAEEYSVEASLSEQLSAAIADEKYELAAKIRDKIARQRRRNI
jgi:hypothetical protein